MTTENEDYNVEQYSQTERDVLAHMLMRSLRGSWRMHRPRAQMLKQLAEAGLTDYDEEKVRARVIGFLGAEHPDGRTFRYIYEEGPSFPEQTEEKVVRRLVGELPPGDLNFDNWSISRYFDSEDQEPEVVCLCGSTRFKDEYLSEQERLTMEGKIFLTVGLFGHSDDVELTDGDKEMLDELHKRKIDLADRVHVIDVDGYVGDSTQSEIEYAQENDIPVTRYSETACDPSSSSK